MTITEFKLRMAIAAEAVVLYQRGCVLYRDGQHDFSKEILDISEKLSKLAQETSV